MTYLVSFTAGLSLSVRKSSAPIQNFHAFMSSGSLFSFLFVFRSFSCLYLCWFGRQSYVGKIKMEFIGPISGDEVCSVFCLRHVVPGEGQINSLKSSFLSLLPIFWVIYMFFKTHYFLLFFTVESHIRSLNSSLDFVLQFIVLWCSNPPFHRFISSSCHYWSDKRNR